MKCSKFIILKLCCQNTSVVPEKLELSLPPPLFSTASQVGSYNRFCLAARSKPRPECFRSSVLYACCPLDAGASRNTTDGLALVGFF